MSLELLVNAAWGVTVWLGAAAAAVFVLGRRPAAVRRSICRLGLLGVGVVLTGAVIMRAFSPSSGLFLRPPEPPAVAHVSAPAKPQHPGPRSEPVKGHHPETRAEPLPAAPTRAREEPIPPRAVKMAKAVPAPEPPVRPLPKAKPAKAAAIVRPPARPVLPVDWRRVIAAAALSVSGLLVLVLAVRMLRLAKWRRTWRPAPPAWVSLTQRLARRVGLRRGVSVFVAPGLAQPAAAGVIRPAIVLPPRAPKTAGAGVRGALSHELGHLDGRDPLWNLLGQAAVALAWWCPLVWWLQRRARIESELTADDHALGSGVRPIDLARTLARFAESNQRPTPVAISGMACHLRRRIEMIMNVRQPHDSRIGRGSRWALTIAAGLVALAIVGTPLVGIADEGGERPRPRREEGGEKAAVRREEGGERPAVRRERGGEGEGRRRAEGRAGFVAAQRIVCEAGVAEEWLGAQARSKKSRRLFWAIRLCPAEKGEKAAVRYDGRYVVVTCGRRRFVIDGQTGQLRKELAARAGREGAGEGERRIATRAEGDRDREGRGRARREGARDREGGGGGRVRREGARDREGEGRGRVRREGARDREREGVGRARREGARDRQREGEGRARREGTRASDVAELRERIARLRRQLEEAQRLLVRLERGEGAAPGRVEGERRDERRDRREGERKRDRDREGEGEGARRPERGDERGGEGKRERGDEGGGKRDREEGGEK